MPRIPFPNVPSLVGVPPLARSAKVPPTARAVLGFAQGVLWRIFQVETQWGVFTEDGQPVIDAGAFSGAIGAIADAAGVNGGAVSTGGVEVVGEARPADFPVERGGFASYNKVLLPGQHSVRLIVSGDESTRAEFLAWMEGAVASTDLYVVVTPEMTYDSVTLERYNYARTASSGATIIIADLVLREVREVSARYARADKSGQLGDVSTPDAAMPVDAGNVQPDPPSSSVLRSLADGFPSMADGIADILREF